MRNAVPLEEHVFGATESDAFRPKRARLNGVTRNISVGANSYFSEWLSPAHQLQQLGIVCFRREGIELALNNSSGGSVERNPVALMKHLVLHPHLASSFIYLDIASARYATLAHAPRDHGRMAGHATTRGQNTHGYLHTVNILRSGFRSHEDDRIFFVVSR